MSRIDQIRKLLVQSPDDTFLLYSLGMELLNGDTPLKAAESFDRVLKLDPDYLPAYSQAAAARRQMGDIPRAIACLQKGLQVAKAQGDRHAADHISLLLEALRPPP